MNELIILKMCDGKCAECDRQRAGVRFSFHGRLPSESSFLCWEHFRLMAAAVGACRSVRQERVYYESCCCPCGCHGSRRRGWTETWCHSGSSSVSDSTSHGQTETWSESEGHSHGRSRGGSSTENPLG